MADLDDSASKVRIAGLEAIRDQANADVERTPASLDDDGTRAIGLNMIRSFAHTARGRLRPENGGYRRDF